MRKVHNFSAGPGILPREVIEQSAKAVLNFNNLDLSILEISHRGKDIIEVFDHACALVKKLLNVPEGYEVIFIQGGASQQFSMVPFNLLEKKAAYLNTGTWAKKAIEEAQLFGAVDVVASSEAQKFSFIPKQYNIPADADYFHITSNNTIYGTQIKEFPNSPVTMVCDMSSDIFSRPVDVSKFGLIYAGAQKNMGPAGATMVIVNPEILGKVSRKIPSMLNYKIHIKGESMYNTPPVFAVYVSMLTLKWLEEQGGVSWVQERNRKKAELFYNELDRNPLFRGTVAVEDRSAMNANFVLVDESLEERFNALLKEARISGLKGHRSVGGYRASMYNAMDIDSVQALVEVMQTLEKQA
ncbi:MAG: 3-phosphoserine/phosphohydroxythreonine transaminase [Flavobacteriales bacterium]